MQCYFGVGASGINTVLPSNVLRPSGSATAGAQGPLELHSSNAERSNNGQGKQLNPNLSTSRTKEFDKIILLPLNHSLREV